MDATTAAAVRRLLLPPRALPPAPPRGAAVSASPRRRFRAAPARASLDSAAVLLDAAAAVAAGGTGYSQASYYTSLGLFVLSVPGLWSLIKRSVKSKIVQKTFIKEEGQLMAPNQVAGEILSFFTRNNFTVSDRGEVITRRQQLVLAYDPKPLGGVYYWTKASRKEEIKVKMILSDDGNVSEILVQGDDVQVEQMRKELKFSEKGMIYVKGIFET
ncbi:unnamed protein product [Miscanthus lutarioriparius]|uniref:Uncharacterized protein n=1 Tax=Miscanthus lutarioriparius TaxID=422564 RepID=A0A811QKX9_9POAL|nr:unnamed protein product [Miscanthus lutarioriparius]